MVPTVYFVTPARLRYEVSDVCFAHRAWCMEEMRKQGIDARCVVIADDENIDLAESYGFDVFEHGYEGYHDRHGRQFLGRKFNDGYEHAARYGAKYVVPIGSDSWIHPCFFEQLPGREAAIQTSKFYAICNERGTKLAKLEIDVAGGVGPNVIPTFLMRNRKYRPVMERIHRGCDGSLLRAIGRRRMTYQWVDADPLQYFAFRIAGEQLNPYERLRKYAVAEVRSPWTALARLHPAELVERGKAIYAKTAVAA